MFYTATALFLLVAGFFFGLQAPAGFVIGFALMVIPPACFSVVVYIRAVERLAPVEVVTPTRAYHLVVALLTAALVVYMAVNLLHEHSAPHFFWIIGAVLAVRPVLDLFRLPDAGESAALLH